MTHTPPIPAGNQSPYPIQESPHKAAAPAPPPGDPRIAHAPKAPPAKLPTALAVAAGVGLAAIAGGLFYALRTKPAPKRKKRKPRKTVQG